MLSIVKAKKSMDVDDQFRTREYENYIQVITESCSMEKMNFERGIPKPYYP